MSKNRKALLAITTALLLTTLESQAQLTPVEGISRQVGSLRNTIDGFRQNVNSELTALSNSISGLRTEADRLLQQQNSAHNCANSHMLYNGSHCVGLPTASAAPAPSASAPTVASAPTPTQNTCTASPELCAIYSDELDRAPDQAGAHFWQGEMDRLQDSGMTAAQAAAEVRQHIAGSNEATTGAMSVEETVNYLNYANTNNISNPTASCTSGTQC